MLLYTETRKRNPSRSRARRELGLGGRNLYKSSGHFCTVTEVGARVSRFRPAGVRDAGSRGRVGGKSELVFSF